MTFSVSSAPQHQVYSVSKLNKEIRGILEQGFASLRLTGEISNFVAPASGHWYFSLKDDKAQIKAAMWRGNNRYSKYRPNNGAQVIVTARVSVYEPRGEYQLIVEHMEPAGEGQLKQQFEALKLQLAAEGLFSSTHKQPLPTQIRKVGVVTSATGAAIKDILTVMKRRAPQLEIIVYPTQVQGSDAHLQIAEKIRLANIRKEVDVLIVGRGGGSLEDLWCFNEEHLAREIFASRLPIISAVGHEIDTTISDYIADLRAPTPSAAAELVSPDQHAIKKHIIEKYARLTHLMLSKIKEAKQTNNALLQRLKLQHPNSQLQQQAQRLDELSMRLQRGVHAQLNQKNNQLSLLQQRFQHQHPERQLSQSKGALQQLEQRLLSAQNKNQQSAQQQLAMLAARLESISPLSVLARGYSITKKGESVVKSIEQVKTGETLITQVHDGEIHTTVNHTLDTTKAAQ
ncbi:exodeoxyribonuclease VII large subunit [Pseudoalteromonas phenolica]|uniref:exodeoxyribonuclease VII large subunit n=1 Tax=Pseudoalteromonas phenolica TaxID=161398 RepID=UPI00110BC25F|nr:exodeoxyribonuclease VII large subunit [Pseudoalteromonas phenolica]